MSDTFITAIQSGDLPYIKTHLTRPGTEINAHVSHGRNALHYAADAGKVPIVRFLIGQRADIDFTDEDGMTPLMAAVDKEHIQTARFLLEMGADMDVKDEAGKDCFEIAKEKNNPELENLLEEFRSKQK